MLKQMLASRWFYIVAVVAMVAIFITTQIEVRGDDRPEGEASQITQLHEREDLNVLFVLIDTLRADRLGSYGYERDTSPNIDALAATGVRFDQHISQSSWTKCSMASMWTGLYPIRTGVLRSPHGLSDDARMPAEILRDAGFRTYALWRNGWIGPSFGFSQGFEVYHSPRAARIPASVRREKPTVGMAGTDQDIVKSAVEFFRTNGDERWFLYLHLMDVHQYVYDETTALFGTSYSDIYDNSIRWVDRVLGSLIDELERRGLRKNTLIILAADHGEAFGEHGREGHARDVYGEVTTTPLILSFPFRLKEGLVVDAATANVDLWPTVLDILELPGLEDPDGRSRLADILVAAGLSDTPSEAVPRYSHIDRHWGRTEHPSAPIVAVNDGSQRLVLSAPEEVGELFDKAADPREQRDIGDERPEERDRLTALVKGYLESPPAPWGAASDVELSETELEQLRALGYAIE